MRVCTAGQGRWYKAKRSFVDFFVAMEAPNKEHDGSFLRGTGFLWGVYSGVGGYLSEDLELEPYLLGRTIPHFNGATLVTPGIRIKQKLDWFDYRAETDVQVGRIDVPGDVSAFQTEAEIGFSLLPKLRWGLGGAVATADDPDTPLQMEGFIDLYPTGHRFFGLTDVFGPRRNALAGFFNLGAEPSDYLTLMMAGHVFHRWTAPEGASRFAGVELDSQLLFKLGRYTSLRGLYGIFLPNDGHFRPEVSGHQWGAPAHFFECQGGVEF